MAKYQLSLTLTIGIGNRHSFSPVKSMHSSGRPRYATNFILRAAFAAKSRRIRLSAAELPDMIFRAAGPKIFNKPFTSSAAAALTSARAAASADGNAFPLGTGRTLLMDKVPAKASPLSMSLSPTVRFSSLCQPGTLTLLRITFDGLNGHPDSQHQHLGEPFSAV